MRRQLTVEDYVQGVIHRNRTILAQTLTLIESNSPTHKEIAQEVLKQLFPHTGNSIRIGITGVPGAGKSSLIEEMGNMLCSRGHRIAVLAIDPSSSITKGSILGDKTRMETLSRNPNAFIRPSASGGALGGVARKTRESLMVCEAAGFDVILVETVGVGQNEVTVRTMVDFFLLVLLTGAGDGLQGIKKGVIELADAILVNKADGDNRSRALATKEEFNRILHYLPSATEGWKSKAFISSSLTGEGVNEIWDEIEKFRSRMKESGFFYKQRQCQSLNWVYSMVEEHLKSSFYQKPGIKQIIPRIESDVLSGQLSASIAAEQLVNIFLSTFE